jgi:hypothetical protein
MKTEVKIESEKQAALQTAVKTNRRKQIDFVFFVNRPPPPVAGLDGGSSGSK